MFNWFVRAATFSLVFLLVAATVSSAGDLFDIPDGVHSRWI